MNFMEDRFFRRQFERERNLSEIGQLFQSQRKQLGLTQRELALRAQTTQSAISQFENATRGVTLEFASRVARAMGGQLEISTQSNLPPETDNHPLHTTTPVCSRLKTR